MRTFLFAALALIAPFAAHAMDAVGYKAMVDETLTEIVSGKITNIDATMARQQKLMEIGTQACAEFEKAQPKFAKLMVAVIGDAPAMKSMTPDQLEEKWGDEGSGGDAVGTPLKSMGDMSKERSYLDSVVHPATALAWFRIYKQTHDAQALVRAKGELTEVLEHLKQILA